jgi:formylglycine-generating enzyme required for sulfatase activity
MLSRYYFLVLLILSLAISACTPQEPAMPPTPSGPQTGDARSDSLGVEQVWVPAGSFLRGTADTASLDNPVWATREKLSEKPQHQVEISRGFWLDKTEVTNAHFQAFVDAGGYADQQFWSAEGWQWLQEQEPGSLPVECEESNLPDHPRVCVTWYEAEAYANWRGGRLPTEAEWEYAARGPESSVYPWGNEWDEAKANVVNSTSPKPVGSYPAGASWIGALDMSGNAMEWVSDWLDFNYYQLEESPDPQGPAEGTKKVEKGGWWGSNPYVARSAYHHFEDPPEYKDAHIGFRILSESTE